MYRSVSINGLRLLSLVCCTWMFSASNASQAQQRWPGLYFGQPASAPVPVDDVPRDAIGGGGLPVGPNDPLTDQPGSEAPLVDDPSSDDPGSDDPVVDGGTPWQEFLSEPFPLLRFLILFLTQLLEALEEIAGGDSGIGAPPTDSPPTDLPPAGSPLNALGR
ncbi:MAG: hypothetical protein ACO1RT_17715 [Planctomycetaceae bacterium]